MPTRTGRSFGALAALLLVAFIATPLAQGGGGGGRGGPGGPGRGTGFPPRDAANATTVGTASISGTVVGEATGNPVRRARVTLTGAELRGGRSVITDDQGRFTFPALPAGRFTMTAAKPGFVDNTYGAKRPGRPGTPIQLAEGQSFNRATISLPRGGVITGVVVDEIGEPASGTQVRVLRYVMRTGERVLQDAGQDTADDRGMYRIFQLQPGEYIVNAEPRNMSVGDLRASISTEVQALLQQAQSLSGRGGGAPDVAALTSLAASSRGSALMDRVAQLQEQLAQAEQQPSTAYAPVYYPGTTSASGATTVTLGVGEERSGVDFQLQLVPTTRVTGIVAGPNGTPPAGTQVALLPADRSSLPGLFAFSINQTRVGPDGRFTFTNVTPGQYSLQARATVRDNPAGAGAPGNAGAAGFGGGRGGPNGPFQTGAITQVLWAAADVVIGGQPLPELVLTLQPGMTVGGRVEFDSGSTPVPTDLTRVRVNLATRGAQLFEIGGTPPGQTEASGHFTITGVAPGRYTLNAGITPQAAGAGRGVGGRGGGAPGQAAGGQWTLKSAMMEGRDVLDFPIDIGPNESVSNAVLTFTDKTQELSGTIQDASGRPTSDFTIILFASDSRYWTPQSRRISSARPGTDGRFTIRGVPAGSYRLTAVTDAEPGEWYDPAFLGQVQQASIPITLDEGARKTQDIRLAGGQ